MSCKTTKEIEREDAIYKIVQGKLEIAEKEYEVYLKQLTNEGLEELLELYCYDEFVNYLVYDKKY